MEKEDLFGSDVREAAAKASGGEYLKGSDFEGDGLTLTIAKPMEKIVSNNPEYGAQEDDWLVEHGILTVGQTCRYTFTDKDGNEKKFDTKSAPFFIGMQSVEDVGVGDTILIQRVGKTNKTRYIATKVVETV